MFTTQRVPHTCIETSLENVKPDENEKQKRVFIFHFAFGVVSEARDARKSLRFLGQIFCVRFYNKEEVLIARIIFLKLLSY